jgi:glycosyltransferase involved in cell wall biosynthesis
VHFAGAQRIKWALDEDLFWAHKVLKSDLRQTSVWRSRILHAAWWPSAWVHGTSALANQQVICFADNAPSFYARQPEFFAVRPFVDRWIARSHQAVREFSSLGIRADLAPYCVDPKVFYRLPREDVELQALRRRLGLPADAYLIGNFHSDTAFTLGPDQPKWQKGPDVFAEIVRRVREMERRATVLLAGPRRHWLRGRLAALGVPVFFVGREMAADDFGLNILERPELNRLYNLLDLCLVSSRWEGGPHSILEACFAKTKVLSTRVGVAEDALEEASLFDTIPEAVDQIVNDIRHSALEKTREPQYRRALEQNTPERLATALRQVYKGFPQEPPKGITESVCAWLHARSKALLRSPRNAAALIGLLPGKSPGVLFHFLRDTLRQSSAIVLRNGIAEDCRWYLADQSWFRSRNAETSPARQIVMVVDQPEDVPPLADAVIVPSFQVLREIPHASSLCAVVIPPLLEGECFNPEVPVPEQLTSTVSGVVHAIRQLFLVLDAPEEVRWLGFR